MTKITEKKTHAQKTPTEHKTQKPSEKNKLSDTEKKKGENIINPKLIKVPKTKKKNYKDFSLYIHKTIQKNKTYQNPITKDFLNFLNSFVHDLFQRLSSEASLLANCAQRQTMSWRDIQTATTLILPKEKANVAIDMGYKAINCYENYDNTGQGDVSE